MFKHSRFFFSAAMTAILFASTLILSTETSAKSKRCPIELPVTMLSLYLKSNSVVIADFKNEDVTKTENDGSGYYANIKRNLNVVKTLKGQKKPEISFSVSEYRQQMIKSEVGENGTPEVYIDEIESYNRTDAFTIGKRYLIFLAKDDETGAFVPAYYRLYSREITPDNAGIYEKRLRELSKIITAKKNQLPNLAEWLVDLTEDEATRWDGATVLARSFASVRYEENGEETEETTLIDKDFNEYSSVIAKHVTEAQKERLSSIFVNLLNQTLLSDGENTDYDYEFAELVGNWDRERFAMYGYSLLLAIDKSDTKKTSRAMNFVANTIEDNSLSAAYYKYTEVIREEENEINIEETANPETVQTETNIKEIERTAENNPETLEVKEQAQTENLESKDEIMTQAQIREQVFQAFVDRYQELLARNFTPEVETEAAEIISR